MDTLKQVEFQKKSIAKKRWLFQFIGIIISMLCLWMMFRKIKFHELQTELLNLNLKFILLGIISLAVGYFFRIYRWTIMLKATGGGVTTRQCAAPFLGSIALNNVLPFRAGDIIRALIFPAAIGMSRVTVTASLILERLIDLLTLLFSLGLGLYLSSFASLPALFGKTIFILAGTSSLILFLIVFFSQTLCSFLNKIKQQHFASLLTRVIIFIQNLKEMSRLRTLLLMFLVSMGVWIGETGLFFNFLKSMEIEASFSFALLMMSIATLSTLLPSSPGYVGPFHLAIFSTMTLLGSTPAQAASFAVIVHLGLWMPSTLAGSMAMLTNPRLFKKIN